MRVLPNSNVPPDPVQLQASQALERGDVEGALAVYEKAVQRDGENLALLADYGSLLWRTYEFERGRAVFADLLNNPHTDPPALKAIAKQLFAVGQFRAAAEAMRVAVDRANPPDSEATELYAGALERDSQIELAREQAQRALSLNPASARAARLLAHIDKREERYECAVQRLHRHLDTYPSDWDWGLRYELAASLDRLGRYDQAWEQLGLAKAQLTPRTKLHLRDSYVVRKRQWELAQRITDPDLTRWFRGSEGLQAPSLRLTLLAGFPRSGTTLLEQMISSHTACVGTDETGILTSQFIAPMVWQAKSATDAIIEIRSFDQDQLRAGRNTYLRLTEAFLTESIGSRLLIEKEPLLTPDLAIPLRLFPDASLLMPLRDPRDVIISYYFTMVPLNWNSAPATSIDEACKFYFDCMRHWLILRDRLPWPTHQLRYEDLVTQPDDTLKKVADFLDLPWDATMLDQSRRSERRAVRTPTYDDITKPISTRAVGRWTKYAEYLEPAMQPLTPFLKAFGYE